MLIISAAPGTLSVGLGACLGALQGVAEFLPISSSGHLSLAQHWLGVDPRAGGHLFNVTVHAGTLLAVLVYYRQDLVALVRGLAAGDAFARRMLQALVVGTLPLLVALVPGFKELIVRGESSPRFVGVCLLITAALLAFTHRRRVPAAAPDDPAALPGAAKSLVIGAVQLLSVAPGISRSGATIATALALGVDRVQAARYSFLLSIPAILGAVALELLPVLTAEDTSAPIAPSVLGVGLLTSFVVGLASLRLLLALLVRVGLVPFVPYLLAVGVVALALA